MYHVNVTFGYLRPVVQQLTVKAVQGCRRSAKISMTICSIIGKSPATARFNRVARNSYLYIKLADVSRNYKFHNPVALYFVSFAVLGWLDIYAK